MKSKNQQVFTGRVRPMQIEDLEQVQSIDQISFSTPWPENAYRFELLENRRAMSWVAELGGESGGFSGELPSKPLVVVGVVVVWFIVDEVHIATLAVHPDYRGLGIGCQLVAEALRSGIQKGAVLATLEVRENNLPAQALYRHFGFEVVGRRLRYYKDNNEDAVLMTVSSLGQDYLDWLNDGARDPWSHTQSLPDI
jgi:ribosomal-protein-alanine N-acetyltransferase